MKQYPFKIVALILCSLLLNYCKDKNNSQQLSQLETPIKKSLWTESEKKKFITSNSNTVIEKYVIEELLSENEFDKNKYDLENFVNSQDFKDYSNKKIKTYTFIVNYLVGKTQKEIENFLGKPNKTELIFPSNISSKCIKNYYLNNLVEIVFINSKSDWITIYNKPKYIKVVENWKFESINTFEDYTFVKFKTK
jgi:hypothetical protein